MLSTSEHRRVLAAYKGAIAQAREATDPETAQRAAAKATELRFKLDQDAADRAAEADELRESEDRSAMARARDVAAGGNSAASPELRDLFGPCDANRPLTRQAVVPLTEARTEYPFKTSDSSNGYGAYATPTTIPDMIVQALVDESGVLQAGPRMIVGTSGEAWQVPTLGTAPTAAAYKTEGAAATETDGILSKVDITTGHIAGYLQASEEFLADAIGGSAQREIVRMCSSAVGKTLATELDTGTGAVKGVFTSAAHGKVAASQTTFTADELLELRASLGTAYRRGAAWLFSDAAYTIALQLKTGEGSYLIQPSATAAAFDTLWGSPVYVDSYGPAVATGNHTVVYGRPESYWLRTVGGIEVTRSDEFAHTSWLATFRFGLRCGGAITDVSGLKALVMA